MANMANILVKDDANPLVEFTLVPITNNRPKWRAQVPGVPEGAQLTMELLANQKLADGNSRRVFRSVVSVLETLGASGAATGYVAPPKVAYQIPMTTTMVVNQRASIIDCANAVKIHISGLAGAYSTTAGGTLNGASAADAVKNNATGPVTRFFVYGEDAY
jgi:hypothetical protein